MELLTYLTKLTKSNSIEVIKFDFRFSTLNKVFLTTPFFLIFFSCLLQAQTITLNSIVPDKSLVGTPQNATLTFTMEGGFSKKNVFKAELSDASGAYNPPTIIGQTTNKSTTIGCTIPGTLPAGIDYRIRVVSTLPVVVISNELPFSITPVGPAESITGSSVVCQGSTGITYSVPLINGATNYIWTLPNDCSIGLGHNSNSISVNFSESAKSGNISVYGTDGTYNGNSSSMTVTVNQLPLITLQPLSLLDACPGTSKSFSVAATGTGKLSYQWYRNGTAIAGATKSIYSIGKVLPANVGTYQVRVTNLCGTTASNVADVSLDAIQPFWITANGSLDITIPCNNSKALSSAQSMVPEVSDNCPTGLVIIKTAGQFVSSGNGTCSGTYLNSWIATDAAGNKSEPFQQTITVDENARIIFTKNATDLTVECDGSGNQTQLINWLTSNAGAIARTSCGAVSWSNNFNNAEFERTGIAAVTFTASDECGNTSTTQATFTIKDNTSPSPDVKNLPNLQLPCKSDVPIPTATDICSGALNGISEDPIVGLSCGTYIIHWYYEDGVGNIYFQNQVIDIIDNTPPDTSQLYIEDLNSDECMDDVSKNELILQWLGPVQNWMKDWVFDDCSQVTITNDYDLNNMHYTCGQAGGYLVITFKIEDNCGNYVEYPVRWNFFSKPPIAQNKVIGLCNGEFDQNELNTWLDSPGVAEFCWPYRNVTWSNNFTEIYNDGGTGRYNIAFSTTNECGVDTTIYANLEVVYKNIGSVEIGAQEGIICEGTPWNVTFPVRINRHECSTLEQFRFEVHFIIPGGYPDDYGLIDHTQTAEFAEGELFKDVVVFFANDGTFGGGNEITLRVLPEGKWADSYNGLAEYSEASLYLRPCETENKSALVQLPVNNVISADVNANPSLLKDESKNDALPAYIKAYPNPFKDEIKFEFSSPFDTHAKLEIFNVLGSSVGIIFNDKIRGGIFNTLLYNPDLTQNQFIIYRMIIGDAIFTGKLIYQK